jgi:hypothetical protein
MPPEFFDFFDPTPEEQIDVLVIAALSTNRDPQNGML